MRIQKTKIPGLCVVQPTVFQDGRGFFMESFNQRQFNAVLGLNVTFVQDNHSCSAKGVLRGMHYQAQQAQGKLVRVVHGTIFDAVVDLRPSSDTFGQWFSILLSADNKQQLWVPAGLAHGFLVVSDSAEVLYKTTDYYAPAYQATLAWDDPSVGIDWPLQQYGIAYPMLSEKDQRGRSLQDLLTSKMA